jgi:mannosyltransferase OCH1-like enzyme
LSGKIGIVKKTPEEIKEEIDKRMNEIIKQANRIKQYKLSKKEKYDCVIPLKIFQTWHTKKLPRMMYLAVQELKKQNPEFQHFLFDDADCREFIRHHFESDILDAFDRLIPGAFKADLWRYCVLYINGGIYLDIKYCCINTFKFIELTEKEYWVRDINNIHVYNAMIVVKPKNEVLLKCIRKIVENVKNRFYGNFGVDPTGPGLVSQFFTPEEKKDIALQHIWNRKENNKYILYNDVAILKMYNGYYNEQNAYQKVSHYSELWQRRQIYR